MTRTLSPQTKGTDPASKKGALIPFGEFPFSLSRMREEFDRLLGRMSREFTSLAEFNGEGWRWGLEVMDEADNVVIRAEAPGFATGDFDLTVEGDRLILRAAKKVETKDDKGKVREFRKQECYESVALPASVDKEKVKATYKDGVLSVTLPKLADAKARRISVKAE